MNLNRIIYGAISGFAAALVVDLNAWSASNGEAFNWKLAVKRWVAGAISGAVSALGIEGAGF